MALEVRKLDDQITVTDADLDDVVNGDDETTYTLRTLTTEKVRDIRRPFVKLEFNKRTHRAEEVPLTEDQDAALTLALLDYALIGWSGVLYQGQPLACTTEHKNLLDARRKAALLSMAGLNRSVKGAAAAESFREPADVRPVLGG